MTVRSILLVAGACSIAAGGAHMGAAQGLYSKVAEIPIGGAGSFDYLNIDSAHRLRLEPGAAAVRRRSRTPST